MKKPVSCVLCIIAGVIVGFVIAGVVYAATGFSLFKEEREKPIVSSKTGNTQLAEVALRVVGIIKDGDYEALSLIAHPEFGVVFSPYATITLSTNKCFQAEHIAAFDTDTKLYVWGVYTGSGEPIELTVADYFAHFVFDRDYTAASVIGVNQIIRSGNALENITDIFRGVRFVDFHIPGSDKDSAEDYDWSTLRLGFEEYEDNLWLTVILHSGWAE